LFKKISARLKVAGAEGQPPADRPGKKKIILVLVAVVAAAALGFYLHGRGRVGTDDAMVDGHIHPISPRVAGYVTQVLVDDNQTVSKGQTLLAIDPTDYEVALAEAKASLAETLSTLTSLELGVPLELSQTSQRVRGAKADLASLRRSLEAARNEEEAAAQDARRATAESERAQLDLKRMQALRASGTVSQAVLDDALTKGRTSEAQAAAAGARLERARKQRASLEADLERGQANIDLAATGQDQAVIKARQVEAQRGRVDLARARLRQAELNLGYTSITAPVDGQVSKKRVEPGQMVAKGQALMALVPLNPGELWVTANYKETQLERVRPGQAVEIEVDAFPGLAFKGKVDSLQAGTGAVFSLFPPENATGNYVKIVQRVPVKIVLEPGGPAPGLRLGMSVVPTILTRD
jgi:membrane fusion protein (multidrug efflux system)